MKKKISRLEDIDLSFSEKLKNLYITFKEFLNKKWSPLYSFNLTRKGKLIGHRRAAIAFSSYIKIFNKIKEDDPIHEFMQFYSQNWEISRSGWSQDIFAMYFSQKIKKKTNSSLKYLEIGGWDGYTSSNTISLNFERGWNGVLVEAEPYSFLKMSLIRKSDVLINAAIVPTSFKSKKIKLYKSNALSMVEGGEGEFGYLDKAIKENPAYKISKNNFFVVKTINVNSILKDHEIDYFSLDIEGLELEIIFDINWQEIKKPIMITVEHNKIEEKRNAIASKLEEVGYQEVFKKHNWLTNGDSWFVLSDKINF